MSQNKKFDMALQSIAAEQPLSLKIKGRCMLPLISDKSVIKVKRKKIYWPGEIITFRIKGGELATHRVIGFYFRRGTMRYLTQADNAIRPDGSISTRQILGKVVGGDCLPATVNIPCKDRLRAVEHFIRFLAGHFFSPENTGS